jgi:phosphohistidine swiveling domain-containing protein
MSVSGYYEKLHVFNAMPAPAQNTPVYTPISEDFEKLVFDGEEKELNLDSLEGQLEMIEKAADLQQVQSIINSPQATSKLRSLAGPTEVGSDLEVLIKLLEKSPEKVRLPILEKFVAQHFARIHASLALLPLCKIEDRYSSKYEAISKKFRLEKLLGFSLPLSLKEPIQAIVSRENSTHCSALLYPGHGPLSKIFWIPPGRDTKVLAVSIAEEIDGYDFRYGGLRLWIHQPRGPAEKAADLLIKQLQEFQSGRRGFVFSSHGEKSTVPAQNYKEMMVYIIRALKEDRAELDAKNSNRIDEAKLKETEEAVARGSSWKSEPMYVIEWAAQSLERLEAEVISSQTEEEIFRVMKKFREIWSKVPSNMDICVATCIDARVLSTDYHQKPVKVRGIPPGLARLAAELGVDGDFSKDRLLAPLSELVRRAKYFPQEVEVLVDKAATLLFKFFEHPDKPLAREFLRTLSTIPMRDLVFDHGPRSFVSKVEDYLGVSRASLEMIGDPRKWSMEGIGFATQYASLFDGNIGVYDPEASYTLLQQLKEYIDKAIKDGEKVPSWGLQVAKNIDSFCKWDRSMPSADVSVSDIKRNASTRLLFPASELFERFDAFTSGLEDSSLSRIDYLENLFFRLSDLKKGIEKWVFENPSTKKLGIEGQAHEAMRCIENIENGIAEEAIQLETPPSKKIICLLSSIAKGRGIVDQEYDDISSFRLALEQAKENRFLGYKELRAQILNSQLFMDRLEVQGMSVDAALMAIQGGFSTGLYGVLDKLFFPQEGSLISGYPTKVCDIIGKVRFLESDMSPAKPGEILVVKNAFPEVHLYKNASAVICEAGGVFCHAAITFKELGIPALLGCPLEALQQFHGKHVHVNFSKKPSVTLLEPEMVKVFEQHTSLSERSLQAIESLPHGIQEVVEEQLFRKAFENNEIQSIVPFLQRPLAQKFIAEEEKALKKCIKRLYQTKNQLEGVYLLDLIGKKTKLLRKVVNTPKYDETLTAVRSEFGLRFADVHSRLEKGGKAENLESVEKMIDGVSFPSRTLSIPAFTVFQAENVVWSKNPQLREKIEEILDSKRSIQEKSSSISELLSCLDMDESILKVNIDGDCIVRSSARIEDQQESAAAGIFSSVVVKDGKTIGSAFLEVLASTFSEKALSFYESKKILDKRAIFDMQLIVQKYISDGKFSGVAFSVGDEKNWDIAGMQLVNGLGGGVDGTTTPAYILINTKDNTLSDLRKTKENPLPVDVRTAKEIAAMMKQLEAYFRIPVEIEFVGNDTELFIVQLRPLVNLTHKRCEEK